MAVTDLNVIDGSIAVVRIDRPAARNALNDEVRSELALHFSELSRDPRIRCAIIAGSREVFAAGADIRAMAELGASDVMRAAGEDAWQPLKTFPKPLIAAVNGWALGGGCELAMHADVIVAGEGAQFGQPEIKIGILPGAGGTQRLARAVGKFKALKMLLTGEAVTAREAEQMGLVSEVVPDELVVDRALEIARAIAALPPLAAMKIKQLVLAGADLPLDHALALERQGFQLMFDTEDQKEGMRAFLEKRPAAFVGR